MASTLTTQISESLFLNGREEGSIKTASYSDISSVFRRTLTIAADTDPHTIVSFTATPDEGTMTQLDADNVIYMRITNLSTLSVGVVLNGATTAVAFKLESNQSKIFNNGLLQGHSTAGSIDAVPTIKIASIEIINSTTALTAEIELFIGLS
tara:strand:+ start:919 stop:1374 length:456 start_codon:yes stop_codon:yes gene_type:complete